MCDMRFDSLLKEHLSNLNEDNETLSGYVESNVSYESLLCDIKALGYSYSIRRSSAVREVKQVELPPFMFSFNRGNVCVPYFGLPFTFERKIYLQCTHGPKYYKIPKNESMMNKDGNPKKRRFIRKDNMKIDCPAKIRVSCIRYFPDFPPTGDYSKWRQKKKADAITKLKEALKHRLPPVGILRYYLTATKQSSHSHGPDFSSTKQRIHPLLVKEIHRWAKAGLTSVDEIRDLLERYVEECFQGRCMPDRSNSAFYPCRKQIYSCWYNALVNVKEPLIDQEAIAVQVEKWIQERPQDSLLFRPTNNLEPCTILFCHQTQAQKEMLVRHGDICVLDSLHMTLGYPLFFLVVGCGAVAGTFVVQAECAAMISEALEAFAAWNPTWHPRHFLTGTSAAEISAVEAAFPSCGAGISESHREREWARWLEVEGLKVEETLGRWRRIAESDTEQDYERNVLEMLDWTESPEAVRYFQEEWLVRRRLWVNAFQPAHHRVDAFTLEPRQLSLPADKTLMGVLKTTVEVYLPSEPVDEKVDGEVIVIPLRDDKKILEEVVVNSACDVYAVDDIEGEWETYEISFIDCRQAESVEDEQSYEIRVTECDERESKEVEALQATLTDHTDNMSCLSHVVTSANVLTTCIRQLEGSSLILNAADLNRSSISKRRREEDIGGYRQ